MQMSSVIFEGSYTDYIFIFGDSRTAYSDYSARISAASGGKIYILMTNNIPCGFLCAARESEGTKIHYGFTEENYRKKGVFSKLMSHAVKNLPKPIKLNILSDHKYYSEVVNVCASMGFAFNSSCNVYRCRSEDFIQWEKYMDTSGNKLCSYLEKHGYSCVSFSEADSKIYDMLYHSSENEFENKLDIKAFFDNPNKNMNRAMSFVVIKDNIPAAYTLVSCPDNKSAVFEHISASNLYAGSGCIIMCFAGSMESFKRLNCKRASYAMYDENTHANSFRKRLLERVTSSAKRSENYILY